MYLQGTYKTTQTPKTPKLRINPRLDTCIRKKCPKYKYIYRAKSDKKYTCDGK